ncbi:MAG: MarR family winged helix-turn-helix transcriptional regulator [Candidatus Marinarcus sp.]|uniref:MarR family winged helix-turn-helix transcriptional regulator n=1 Tax=Candidatus Marinarcus sp. TaxID=3100987 RepID=UPI003AFFD1DF
MSFKLDNVFGVLIANIRNSLKNNLEKELMKYDISASQSIILRRLCEKDNLTQKELAEDTYFLQPSLTLLIDKLERKGLVQRQSKLNDRRAYNICITQKGRELEKILIDASNKVENEAFQGMDENNKTLLIQMLKTVYSNVK